MIDNAADKNLIDPELRKMLQIRTKERANPLIAKDIQRREINRITHETEEVWMNTGQHSEQITFQEMHQARYKITLGREWLEQHNPEIDWCTKQIRFTRCKCKELYVQSTEVYETWDQLKNKIPKEFWHHRRVFEEPPEHEQLPKHKPWDHEIPLKDGTTPEKLPMYTMSPGELKELKEYLDSNLRRGYIRPSTSEAGYPVIFVPKKDKQGKWTKKRLCVDYRRLNAMTKKNRYPLPLIEELQDRLQGAKWFTKLDIREGYYRIRIKEGEEWKTAFRTRYGLYEYQVMPFGLTNAPATFQGLINHLLYDHLDEFVVAYLDDILIYSQTREEHVKHVNQVLERLAKEDLTVKPEKCEFFTQETEFLGHLITPEGLQMHPDKIKAILEYPRPTNQKEILAFQGLAGYYRRFITGFSKITTPITNLLRKDRPFEWTEAQEQAFQAIKDEFKKEPILVHFDYSKSAIIDADASKQAIGARLQQRDDQGRPRLVACYARKLTPAEQNYDIHDREMLAIVEALQRWRSYLSGAEQQTEVMSDHKNLQYFMTSKKLNGRQARWAEVLAEYNFVIRHCKGKDNAWADALSRRPDLMENNEQKERAPLLRQGPEGLKYNHEEIAVQATTLTAQETDLTGKIKKETQQDRYTKRIVEKCRNGEEDESIVWIHNGLIIYDGLIFVPRKCRKEVIREEHDQRTAGHFGIARTMERVSRNYYFPGMRREIEQYVRNCDICRRAKHKTRKEHGKLQPLQVPTRPWESVTMDFIVKLPKSREPVTGVEYDSIMTVVDRFTKRAYFIPYLEATGAEETAYVFDRHIGANHGVPAETITDRDTRFKSRFWQGLMAARGIKHKMATTGHAQTDGQTERMNQVIEQYLRCFTNYQQDDWVKLLPMAQFAYNDSMNSVTGMTPFFANYGMEMEAYRPSLQTEHYNEKAKLTDKELRQLHRQLQLDLRFIQRRMKQYYDSKREDAPTFREGQKVYLSREFLRTKRPCEKLDFKKLGPYKIKRQTGPVNFELKLPKHSKVYPIFHVSLLEPAPQHIPESKLMDAEGYEDQDYEVEKILATSQINGKQHWLVKWKGYNTSENTWEPIEHLASAQEALRGFQKRQATPRNRGRRDQTHQGQRTRR
jgi:hypothetical protein